MLYFHGQRLFQFRYFGDSKNEEMARKHRKNRKDLKDALYQKLQREKAQKQQARKEKLEMKQFYGATKKHRHTAMSRNSQKSTASAHCIIPKSSRNHSRSDNGTVKSIINRMTNQKDSTPSLNVTVSQSPSSVQCSDITTDNSNDTNRRMAADRMDLDDDDTTSPEIDDEMKMAELNGT